MSFSLPPLQTAPISNGERCFKQYNHHGYVRAAEVCLKCDETELDAGDTMIIRRELLHTKQCADAPTFLLSEAVQNEFA